MEDFRVGSVPSPDPYGNRRPSGSNQRNRQGHQDAEGERQPDEAPDIVQTPPADSQEPEDAIEDYYLPSEPDDTE